jgi:hypothetical protein
MPNELLAPLKDAKMGFDTTIEGAFDSIESALPQLPGMEAVPVLPPLPGMEGINALPGLPPIPGMESGKGAPGADDTPYMQGNMSQTSPAKKGSSRFEKVY